LTAWYFLRYSGVYWDWSEAAREIEGIVAAQFRPEIVWATFLPSDALVIAQRLAKRAGCPWILDLKDAWSYRLPRGLRHLIARWFRDANGITANSRFHGTQGEQWFKKGATTLYDGISDAFLKARPSLMDNLFRIMLVGSTYGKARLISFLEGLRNWLLTLPEGARASVRLTYAGSDSAAVRLACDQTGLLKDLCEVEILGYLPLVQLADLCASASVNAYLWLPSTFHHKLLELLACGRPVIVFPGENDEASALASKLSGDLRICKNEEGLSRTLRNLWQCRNAEQHTRRNLALLETVSWDSQAEILERALLASNGHTCS
jgi:glycosyltransferase involved in cell wall biosynthesis